MNQSLPASIRGWKLFLCGICMGASDLVPGISGGTVAFILGFYQPLLNALKTLNGKAFRCLIKGKWDDFSRLVEWKFILTLLSGIGVAFACLANLFHVILSHEVYRIYFYAVFFGLIFASFVYCVQQVKRWNAITVSGLCAGAVIAFFLTESTLSTSMDGNLSVPLEIPAQLLPLRNYDQDQGMLLGLSPQTIGLMVDQGLLPATTPVYDRNIYVKSAGEFKTSFHASFFHAWLVFCGSLAVCALLLPGISGSYILTLLGVYPLVIEALVEFVNGLTGFSFHHEAFAILACLGVGIAIGALVFAKGVSWLLNEYSALTLAILSGFMMGGIRSVWPFWTFDYVVLPLKMERGLQLMTVEPFFPSLLSPLFWQAFLCAMASFFLVFSLERYAQLKAAKKQGG